MYIGTVNFLYSELAQAHPKLFKIYTVFPQNLTAVRFKAVWYGDNSRTAGFRGQIQ